MQQPAVPAPQLSPRDSFFFVLSYLAAVALCLAVPRALSFLPATVALLGGVYLSVKTRTLPAFDGRYLAFFAGFGALACLSALWSPDPGFSLEKGAKIAALLITGIIPLSMAGAVSFDTRHKNLLICGFAYLCAIAGAAIFFEYNSRFLLSRIATGVWDNYREWPTPIMKGFLMNRSSVFLVLLTFPAILMLRTSDMPRLRKNILTAVVAIAVGAALYATNSQTAQVAALLAVPVWFYPAARPLARNIILFLVMTMMLCAPFLIKPVADLLITEDVKNAEEGFLVEASVPHRFEVWGFVAEEIIERPVIGHGIEATRFLKADHVMPRMRTDHVLHPHNAVLQIWIEFGALGIVIATAFVFFLFRSIDAMPPVLQRYNIAFFLVLLGVLSMGYGLWQAWLIGMVQTLVALAIVGARLTGADAGKNKNGDPQGTAVPIKASLLVS